MAIYESEEMLWAVSYLLLALIYPLWYLSLIVFSEKDKQVDPVELAKQENPYG